MMFGGAWGLSRGIAWPDLYFASETPHICPKREGFGQGASMSVLALIIIGAAAGLVATRLMRLRADLVTTMAIGIGGALIGYGVLRVLLVLTGMAAGFVGAVLGAVLLIWIWRHYIARD